MDKFFMGYKPQYFKPTTHCQFCTTVPCKGCKPIIHTLLTCNTNTEFPEWMFNKFRR